MRNASSCCHFSNTWIVAILVVLLPLGSALGFYYPPENTPPGPPPNYTPIDSSYFIGTPPLPIPPPTLGGFYIWWDGGEWTIANHIYSLGNTLEQFHGSILAVLDQPPQLNVNVFIEQFEHWGDTTSSLCLDQNDRWGWVQWDTDLYEIWWDVTTKEKKTTGEDLNDIIILRIAGCALDFNLWSSAHGGRFGPDQVYLGADMRQLSSIPEYSDAFVGIEDPYQSQAGSDPESDPNITIFTPKDLPGESYNKFGLITGTESFPCDPNYGERYVGSFAYEGNGIQFSTSCIPPENKPPDLDFPSGTIDTSYFACVTDSICVTVVASDPDPGDTITLSLLSGPVSYEPVTSTTTITDEVCFFPDTSGIYRFIWQVVDNHGAESIDTVDLVVTLNTPPVLIVPPDTTVDLCGPEEICVSGIYAYDVDSAIAGSPEVRMISGPGVFEPAFGQVCFTPDTAGTYQFIFEVCDSCLEPITPIRAATLLASQPGCPTDTLLVIVSYNDPPYINVPPVPEPIVCVPADGRICISGWEFGDPDGDPLTFDTKGTGIFDTLTGTFCTEVAEPGDYTQTLVVTDTCGNSAEASLTFTVLANEPPVVDIGVTDTALLCAPDTVCLDVTITDPDDTLWETTTNIGTLDGGRLCFTADTAGTYTVIVTATDECGNVGADTALVPVQMNQPPYIEAPDTASASLCADDSLACFNATIAIGDPDAGDNLTLHLPDGATYDSSTGTLCMPFAATGWYEVEIGASDDCGLMAWDTIHVNVVVNDVPAITFSLPDTTINVCSPDTQICFYVTAEDPAGNPVVIDEILNPGFFDASTGLACFNPDSICFDHPSTVDTTICVIFRATGECGSTIDSLCLQIVSNSPPTVELPDDTTLVICDLTQVCVGPVTATDPDGDDLIITGINGELISGQLCFYPEDLGTFVIGVEVADSCGHVVRDSMSVTVVLNQPPTVSWIDDFDTSLCAPGEVCVPAALFTDPEGGVVDVTVLGAENRGDQYCFNADTVGVYTLIATGTDTCGASVSDTLNVTIDLNSPPALMIRAPRALLLCDIDTVMCYPIMVSDPDGDQVTLSLSKTDLTIFSLVDGEICIDAAAALAGRDSVNCVATIVGTDDCGAQSQTTLRIILRKNLAPYAILPADTSLLLCEPQNICVGPMEYGDPNGEQLQVQYSGGTISGDQLCAYVDHDTTLVFTLTVTDSCGLSATDTTYVDVKFDQPPTLSLPDISSLNLCALEPVCIDGIVGNDPEWGEIPAEMLSGPGTFDSRTGQLCFTPDTNGIYEWTFAVSDDCNADTGTLSIEVTTNQPPVFGDSPDTSVFACLPGDEICIQFDATDPEADPITYALVAGLGTIDPALGTLCFSPDTSGTYEIVVSASDSCGTVLDTGYVAVTFNSAPEITFSSSDTSIYVCNPDTLLCFNVFATDPDGETPTIREILNPGTFNPETGEFCFNPDSVCFDDPATVDTTFCLIFAATDSCGAETIDTFCVEVTRNRPPVVNLGRDWQFSICKPDTSCIDLRGGEFYPGVSDPDGDDLTVTVSGAGFLSDSVTACVIVDTAGVYEMIVCATDPCGLEACDTLYFRVYAVNRPPTVELPPDTTVIACTVDEVCIGPVVITDPDTADVPSVSIVGDAVLVGTDLCFSPTGGDSTYTFIVTVTDRCGATDEDTITVTVDANDPPVLTFLTPDTTVNVCNPDTELCFQVTASDPDGDIPVIDEILNPGFFDPLTNTFCIYPDSVCFDSAHVKDTTVCVIFRATDACGAQVVDSMCITLIVNKPPELHFSVPDTSLFLCNPDTSLCFDVWGTDPEGDSVVITEIRNPGVFYPEIGQFCFNPDSVCFDGGAAFDHSMCLIFEATDACGNSTIDSLCLNLTANHPPVVTAPDTVDAIICALGDQVCVEGVSASDVEDGILDVTVPGAKYDLATQTFCFNADTVGTYVFTASATDYCETSGEKTVVVRVALNGPPVLALPPDTSIFYCGADVTCFEWSLSDPENDSLSLSIDGPAYVDTSSGLLCVRIDSASPVTVIVTASDPCGASATDTLVVTPTFNTPPVITLPADTVVRVCEPGTFCLGPVSVTDLDGNFEGDIQVEGGWYDSLSAEICVDITADGQYIAIVTATDACGATDVDTVIVDATVNRPPVTSFNVPDTSLYLCNPDTLLCFTFSATDPDGGSVVLNEILNPGTFDAATGEFCFRPSDVCFTDPTVFDTTLCLLFSASDDCGATTIDSLCLQITANRPPVVTGPADTTVSLCNPDTVCLGPFDISDPNGVNDTLEISITGPAHTFDTTTGMLCFLASEGDYTFVVTATDRCGAMAVDSIRAHVTGNTAPVITLPDDYAEKVCVGDQLCVPVTISDADIGDSLTVTVLSGGGTYNSATGEVCVTPDSAGDLTLIVAVQDLCGASDQDTITVAVTLNQPPFWTDVPSPDSTLCAAPAQLCYVLVATDPDGDAIKYTLVSGPGTIDSISGSLCFAPGPDPATYTFVVKASDDCGAEALDTLTINLDIDRAPQFGDPPRDTILSQCEPAEICFPPLNATDPDGDSLVYEIISGLGTITGNQFCFTPDTVGTGSYCFTVRVVDPCGKADTTKFCAQVNVNRPPVIELPIDFAVDQCNPGEVCFNDILVSDPDGQALTVELVSGPGSYNSTTGQVCFTPSIDGGVYTFVMRAVDPCGIEDRDTVNVTVNVNQPPTLVVPSTVSGCVDSTVCFDVHGSDPDAGDVVTIVQLSGPGGIAPDPITGPSPATGTWCWSGATEGTSEVVFRITDECGAVSYDTTLIQVDPYCDSVCFASDIEVICPDSANPNHWLFQGRPFNFSVNAQVNRPVAAFDFLIGYDATALTIAGVSKGDGISSWEFFTYRVLDASSECSGIACPSGLVRILGIADMNNGTPFTDSAQILPGGGSREFARLTFQVSNDRTLAGQFIPVKFWWNDCGDNTFSSPEGTLYVSSAVDPDTCITEGAKTSIIPCASFSDGGGCIPRASDIDDLGDLNLNGFAYEIGDAVLYSNYFIFGASVLDPNPVYRESQIAASDVNGDGQPLTLADLVFLIQVIVGNQEPIGGGGAAKAVMPSGHGTLTFANSSHGTEFALSADRDVGGIALVMDVDGIVDDVVPTDAVLAAEMKVQWHQEGSTLRVLMFSPQGKSLPAGESHLFVVKGARSVSNLDGELAGAVGNVMSLNIAVDSPLPQTYELDQNYPNPFNPETEIRFTLGQEARVRLTIYNILGQPVSTLVDDKWLAAGEYRYKWQARNRDGSNLPSGVYMYRLQANDYVETKKMLLLR